MIIINGNLYSNPTFPGADDNYSDIVLNNTTTMKNNYNLDVGLKVKVYSSYPNSSPWQNKIFIGIIKQIQDEVIIVKDLKDNILYYIKYNYIDYVEIEQ